ncbi:MAG: TetR/AcrR family transcriptional regulator [Proteobacteria bacterium]|nr:TetR/AcrR family transcriptional regulator [Pseudomonadota bacterium]
MAKTKSGCGMDNRKIIIETAMKLISSQGIDKTSLARIAEKAGISKGTLYYYYSTKNDLLFDIADVHIERITGDIFSMIEESRSDVSLEELLTLLFNSLLSSETSSRLHLYLIREAIAGNSALKKRFQKTYFLWFAMVNEAFEKMFRTDPEIEIKAKFLVAVIDGFIIQALLSAEKANVTDIVAQMLKVIDNTQYKNAGESKR